MSFGFPVGLLALSALLPLAAAYFLRRRQRPRVVSALFLWRSPSQRAQAGPRFERFSREASLLFEALAVLAAALYLADLRLGAQADRPQLVVVVDGSLSMSARPARGKATADRAREAVARAVSGEGAALLTVVESGVHPRVLTGPRAPVVEALAALEKWKPLGAAHDFSPALLFALDLAGPGRRFWFVTDGPLPSGTAVPPEAGVVEVGEPADNLALVSAQRRDEADLAQVTVRVASFAADARSVEVSFHGPAADGARPGGADRSESLRLPPGETAVLRVSFANAGPIEVRLPLSDDALVEDGKATLLPAPVPELRVGVLEGLGPAEKAALERVLDATPGVRRAAAGGEPAELTFGPRGSKAQVQIGAPGPQRSFVGPFVAEKAHPLLEDVGFGGVLWTAGDNPPGRPLVTAGSSVLLSEEEAGTVQMNIELARSNVQRTSAWPVLVGNALRCGRRAKAGLPRHQLMLGEPVPVVTEASARFTLVGPEGERPVLGAGAVQLPAPAVPGSYALLRDGREIDRLEVLTLDPRESDLRGRAAGLIDPKREAGLEGGAPERRRAAWPLVLLLCLLLADFWVTARAPA